MNKKTFGLVALILFLLLGYVLFAHKTTADNPGPINLRIESFALNFDPQSLSDTESRRIGTLLHLGLVRIDQDGNILPGVATEWSKAGLVYSFKIKPAARFSDGSPITADAVRDSLCRSMQPDALYSWSLASIDHKTSADTKAVACDGIVSRSGDGIVEIRESAPKPWFLEALAGPGGWITKTSDKKIQYGNIPGAGPFRLKEVVPDTKVVLEARADAPITAKAGRVSFVLIKDDAQAATEYIAGRLDALDVANPSLAGLLKIGKPDQATGKLEVRKSDRMRILIFNRNSLKAKGYGPEMTEALLAKIRSSYDRSLLLNQTPSLALAASLPFPFSLTTPESPTAGPVSLAPKELITVITESDPYSDYIASIVPKSVPEMRIDYKGLDKGLLIDKIVKGNFDIASVAVEATLHAPEFWISFFRPGSPFTIFGESLDALKDAALQTDRDRNEALSTIARYGNWVGLIQEQKVVLMRPGLNGIRFTPTGQLSYEEIQVR